MSNQLLLDILSLADRIEDDRSVVWEWFFRTPIWPHGVTAFELAQSERGHEVIAFLERVLAEQVMASGANDLHVKHPLIERALSCWRRAERARSSLPAIRPIPCPSMAELASPRLLAAGAAEPARRCASHHLMEDE